MGSENIREHVKSEILNSYERVFRMIQVVHQLKGEEHFPPKMRYSILNTLRVKINSNVTVADLAREFGEDYARMKKYVKGSIQEGYIKDRPKSKRSQIRYLKLTSKGGEVLSRYDESSDEALSAILNTFDEDGLEKIMEGLRIFRLGCIEAIGALTFELDIGTDDFQQILMER